MNKLQFGDRAVLARWIGVLLMLSLLGACVAPALLLSPQGQLMWALLKPLVGLDPKAANLFEQPLLKGRMQALLGDNYDTAVTLLNTANKIQQEGPLFYLVSQHTPIPQLAEKAGFVWNAQTNQMAVLLVTGGAPLVFAEQLNQQMAKVVPEWPAELMDYTDPVKLKQMAIKKAAATTSSQLGLSEQQTALATAAATGGDVKQLAVTQAQTAASEQVSSELGLSASQSKLVSAAIKGEDVQQLAKTQATTAATDAATAAASQQLGLSDAQTELAKTAATGGDVKKVANQQLAQQQQQLLQNELQQQLAQTKSAMITAEMALELADDKLIAAETNLTQAQSATEQTAANLALTQAQQQQQQASRVLTELQSQAVRLEQQLGSLQKLKDNKPKTP